MVESDVYKIVQFIRECDIAYENGNITQDMVDKAKNYIFKLKKVLQIDNSALIMALHDKLKFIIKIYNANSINSRPNNKKFSASASINLIDYSLSDFIIHLVKENRLTDPKLIARFVYLELSKHLYYDISYTQITDKESKSIIVDTPIDVTNAKIFSYVVCTQWMQLYTYILSKFGINVRTMSEKGSDHVWGEVQLNNDEIIICDACEYIDGSIDLSNAKSTSPTKGFIIVPSEYSGIRMSYLHNLNKYKELKEVLLPYYDQNRELDIELGYIENNEYPVEKIIKENDIFYRGDMLFATTSEKVKYLKDVKKFLLGLDIPTNMDGYEAYAFYHMYLEKLSNLAQDNCKLSTIYTDTFNYKQNKVKTKRLEAPDEYLRYLQDLIYNRYYQYLSNDEYNKLFSKVEDGLLSNETLGEKALEQEMLVAQINRRLNPYYAINELTIYEPFDDFNSTYLLYEPSSGKKIFTSYDEANQYMIENKIK